MSLRQFIITYFLSIFIFIAIDSVWLVKIAPKMYKKYIGHLMAQKPNLKAAALFYLIYLFGLIYLVVLPAFEDKSLTIAVQNGLVYGLACYATFDLTSQAVFKKWPTKITAIDLIWGGLLTTIVSVVTYLLASALY